MQWHTNVNCKIKRWEHCGPEEVLIYSHVQYITIQTQKPLFKNFWKYKGGVKVIVQFSHLYKSDI